MAKQDPPKKKKFADLDNYLQDFSATASTTSTKQLPIDAKKLIEQDKVAKLREENNRKAAELAKQGYGYKGNVPQQGTVDYPATDRRSANYMGNPNMQFAAPNMKGQMRADVEGYHNDIIGGELAGLGIGAGISKGVNVAKNLPQNVKNYATRNYQLSDDVIQKNTNWINKETDFPTVDEDLVTLYRAQAKNFDNLSPSEAMLVKHNNRRNLLFEHQKNKLLSKIGLKDQMNYDYLIDDSKKRLNNPDFSFEKYYGNWWSDDLDYVKRYSDEGYGHLRRDTPSEILSIQVPRSEADLRKVKNLIPHDNNLKFISESHNNEFILPPNWKEQSKPLMADGGQLNNNNGMINEYKGDSHFDPSGGIELNNAIVEDGELEYKGYVFSKDSEENRQLRKEMRLRKLRTDDDDYVTDAISRRSLNRAAIPLVESHEKKRIDRLMADLEKAEKQMDEAGIPPQGDMPLDPSMMGDPSMGLPMMAEGGFVPKITTNQQYDQTFIDPSNMNDASTASFSPAGTKSRGSDAAKAANYIGAAANTASSFLPENPYPDKGKEVGAMNAAGDAIAGAVVPFYNETNQIAELGTGLRNQGIQDNNEALEITGSTIEGLDQFGSRMKSIDMADKGIITEEENAAIQVLDFFVPILGNNILNDKEKQYYEELAARNELQEKLDNRDYGGTEMEAQGERNRYLKYGGKRIMSKGGDKDEMRPNQEDFLYGESMRLFDPSATVTGTDIFAMGEPLDYEGQDDEFSQRHRQSIMNNRLSDGLTTIPQGSANPTYSVSGKAQGPNTPMSMIDSSKKEDKVDWANIGESVGMGLLGNIGNLAYLFDEGKDYDKVSYGRYNPETVNASSSRRAIRDAMATSKEALKESGRLDRNSLALLGTQSAQQLADAEERVRLANTGMLNDAQLKNLEVGMREQDDTARNKGAALTNYYNALGALGQNAQAAYRGHNLRMSDAEKQRLVAENNLRLQELLKEFKTV